MTREDIGESLRGHRDYRVRQHPRSDDEIGAAIYCSQGGFDGVEPVGQIGVREQTWVPAHSA